VLAAYRAGLRHVLLPESNEKDLREVAEEVRKQMQFTFVSSMDQVLHLALLPKPVSELADAAPEPPPVEVAAVPSIVRETEERPEA